MKNIMFCILLFCFCISCKKTEVSGVVYSKSNIPMSNVIIKLDDAYNHHSPSIKSEVATTDNNGHYYYSFKAKNSHAYTVFCNTDSGSADAILHKDKVNTINLYLR